MQPFKMINRRRRERRGASAVEFAMVAPAFAIVLVVCVEFSRISILRNTSQSACYEAARLSIAEGARVNDALQQAKSVISRLGPVQAKVTINGNEFDISGMDDVLEDGEEISVADELDFETREVTVRMEIPLNGNMLLLPDSMFDDEKIVSQVTMKTERYQGFFDADSVD